MTIGEALKICPTKKTNKKQRFNIGKQMLEDQKKDHIKLIKAIQERSQRKEKQKELKEKLRSRYCGSK